MTHADIILSLSLLELLPKLYQLCRQCCLLGVCHVSGTSMKLILLTSLTHPEVGIAIHITQIIEFRLQGFKYLTQGSYKEESGIYFDFPDSKFRVFSPVSTY